MTVTKNEMLTNHLSTCIQRLQISQREQEEAEKERTRRHERSKSTTTKDIEFTTFPGYI
jgi:hypothetical protein